MQSIANSYRGAGLDLGVPMPSDRAEGPTALIARCPAYAVTPLVEAARLAEEAGVARLWVKDERARMGLGSFKALGAAYVIADAAQRADQSGVTYVTASAGNHGLSVAAGAQVFGARAVIYLSNTVPERFATRLQGFGAEVVRAGEIYEESMAAAAEAARENGWTLLSDSSWDGYTELSHRLMEGYLVMAAEAAEQMPEPPSHILLQAGVGGLAGAVAAYARRVWGDGPQIIVVEPDAAPALAGSIKAGRAVASGGPVSCMGRLDCKEPSLIALQGLSRDADRFVTITEAEAEAAMPMLTAHELATTPSGGAGLAALLAGAVSDPSAKVLCILSETAE